MVQSYQKPGAVVPDQTEVRVLYDDDALYVGIRMVRRAPGFHSRRPCAA